MVDNIWSQPEGVPRNSRPIHYRILDRGTGESVDRFTQVSYDHYTESTHHALDEHDQHVADHTSRLIQRACRYFYEPDETYVPREGVDDIVVSDDEVRDRINRLENGENRRESIGYNEREARTGLVWPLDYFRLSDLPWDQQRALVEQLLAYRRECGFEIVGPATDAQVLAFKYQGKWDYPEHLG